MSKFTLAKVIVYFLLLAVFQIANAGSETGEGANEATLNDYGAEPSMDDFFELSPSELANIPIEIASGSARPAKSAAGVTTVITADQIEAM